jgi:protein-tyrosine phosphatase
MINILFVCAGNICRSPMADAILRHLVTKASLGDRIAVDSAGTGSWHVGEAAHSGTLAVLQEHEIAYDGRSRQLKMHDFATFDYILAMDHTNLAYIMRVINRGEWSAQQKLARFYGESDQPEVALFLSYANRAGTVVEAEVPDPYYDGRFEATYDLVYRGCVALLEAVRTRHHL